MICYDSFINTVGEYACDCELRSDMLLRITPYKGDLITIETEFGFIVVTPDTMIMTSKGLWKRAKDINVGDNLKSYTMNYDVVTMVRSEHVDGELMINVVDNQYEYLIVDNFYIS